MKNRLLKNKKFYLIISLFLLCFTCGIFGASVKNTYAEQTLTVATKVEFPLSRAEVFDLDTYGPRDAIYFGNNIALIREDNTLWISKNGNEFFRFNSLLENNPGQIKALDDKNFIVSDNLNLYMINVELLTIKELSYDGRQITASSFDINNNFMIAINEQRVTLYSFRNGEITSSNIVSESATKLTPVCVGSNGKAFYIQNNNVNSTLNLCVYDYTTPSQGALSIYEHTEKITQIICDDNFVYFIKGSEIFKLATDKSMAEPQVLSVANDKNFELGSLSTPKSLSFKNSNLLVGDTTKACVQEFRINQNTLEFTGFAIAKNKTAFNRTSQNTIDVESYATKQAFLTADKIMVVDKSKNFNAYEKSCYLNLFASDLGGNIPNKIALGKRGILLVNTYTSSVSFYLFDKGDNQSNLVELKLDQYITIHDACYQSGYYYVIATTSNDITTYKISESDLSITQTSTTLKTNPRFTVDVFGNAHVYHDTSIIKIESDLVGNVYAIKQDGFYKLNKQTDQFELVLSAASGKTIKTFTMDFDKNEVYLLYENDEFVYSTISLENVAINGTLLPNDFKVSDANANTQLKYYLPTNQNVYSVALSETDMSFLEIVNAPSKYIFVCELPSINHYLLVGQEGFVIAYADASRLEDATLSMQEQVKRAFTHSDVNAYYIPIIAQSSPYSLCLGEQKIRLSATTPISVSKVFTFLEKQFYLCEFEYNGQTHVGYVPVNFTTDMLSEDYTYDIFTIEKVDKVEVYDERNMQNKIFTLHNGDTIRLLSNDKGICHIKFFDGETWQDGYINGSAINNQPNTTIRNILIILVVATCLCGTTTYFLIRRKRTVN